MSACTCMSEMDYKLAAHNTQLQFTFGYSRDGSTWLLPLISTEKLERKVRKGPALAIPTFCPFCGTRYQPENAQVSA